jgi:hypothetical protein
MKKKKRPYKFPENFHKLEFASTVKKIFYRCYIPENNRYEYYGARGIKVCDEWKKDPLKLHQWLVDNNYQHGLEIDRRDNDGDYEPNNCRVVDHKVSRNNMSTNRLITIDGRTQNLQQWLDEVKLGRRTFYTRIKLGWSEEKAILTLSKRKKK